MGASNRLRTSPVSWLGGYKLLLLVGHRLKPMPPVELLRAFPLHCPFFWKTSEAQQWLAQNESAVQSRVGDGCV